MGGGGGQTILALVNIVYTSIIFAIVSIDMVKVDNPEDRRTSPP